MQLSRRTTYTVKTWKTSKQGMYLGAIGKTPTSRILFYPALFIFRQGPPCNRPNIVKQQVRQVAPYHEGSWGGP
jgi:hypothetical protein